LKTLFNITNYMQYEFINFINSHIGIYYVIDKKLVVN